MTISYIISMGTASVFEGWSAAQPGLRYRIQNGDIVPWNTALTQAGLCPQDVHGSVWQADPPVGLCSLTPDRHWSRKTHTVKGSMGIFYNPRPKHKRLREVFSEWPVPDLHPIRRRAAHSPAPVNEWINFYWFFFFFSEWESRRRFDQFEKKCVYLQSGEFHALWKEETVKFCPAKSFWKWNYKQIKYRFCTFTLPPSNLRIQSHILRDAFLSDCETHHWLGWIC